jgi:hypothetical protein
MLISSMRGPGAQAKVALSTGDGALRRIGTGNARGAIGYCAVPLLDGSPVAIVSRIASAGTHNRTKYPHSWPKAKWGQLFTGVTA